jgi:hypothetical protein
MIWFPDAEILEKDFIQFIIVILARMHQDMFRIDIQLADYPAEFYYLGARTNNCHYSY